MNELLPTFLNKRKRRRVLGFTLGISFYVLSILLLVLGCLYFESLGKSLFYGVFLTIAIIFTLFGSFFLSLGISSACELSFFKAQNKRDDRMGQVISINPYSVNRHFESYKVSLKDGSFLYWATPFGECPLKEGDTYHFVASNSWILGWEKL